jgi:hypothetical protein
LRDAITKYHIQPCNIYNWDEKSFLIGLLWTLKHIVLINTIKDGRSLGAAQDGSRKFISLLACISAAGKVLPLALIYEGSTFDLQNT